MFHPHTEVAWWCTLEALFCPPSPAFLVVFFAGKKSTVGMRLWCKRVTLETRCTCTLAAVLHSGTLWGRYTIFIDMFSNVMWLKDTRHPCYVMSRYPDSLQPDIATTSLSSGSGGHVSECIPNLSRKSSNFHIFSLNSPKKCGDSSIFGAFAAVPVRAAFPGARLCVGKCSVFRGYNTEPWPRFVHWNFRGSLSLRLGIFRIPEIDGGIKLVPEFWRNCGDIPWNLGLKNKPYIWYLQFRFLKWPLNICVCINIDISWYVPTNPCKSPSNWTLRSPWAICILGAVLVALRSWTSPASRLWFPFKGCRWVVGHIFIGGSHSLRIFSRPFRPFADSWSLCFKAWCSSNSGPSGSPAKLERSCYILHYLTDRWLCQ